MVNLLLVKLLATLLKKNGYKVQLGGNIGTPVLDLKIRKDTIFSY